MFSRAEESPAAAIFFPQQGILFSMLGKYVFHTWKFFFTAGKLLGGEMCMKLEILSSGNPGRRKMLQSS
jgi:hypothetical protein